jgi:nitrite reductase/ring-hydroxylating ferredoxin subunit
MARHVVAKVDEIPEGGRVLVELQGRSIGIFHVKGRYYALLNRCPHRGAELCRGSVLGRLEAPEPGAPLTWDGDRQMLQCPWHGWEYDIETGQSYTSSRVRPYPIELEGGGEVAAEIEEGKAVPVEGERPPAERGEGLSGPALRAGPFVAETFPIEVEDSYLVVTLPGRLRPAA